MARSTRLYPFYKCTDESVEFPQMYHLISRQSVPANFLMIVPLNLTQARPLFFRNFTGTH